ncbi:Replication protein [Nesidiocoris tenuis]|uniref:Replication protein n=1 Tax=Nesidiocoris tenuis TaxID=355587 RepID=A0ABN7AFD7_9HEMI|nr:Replication protein [Nesidiocoris tenuis]
MWGNDDGGFGGGGFDNTSNMFNSPKGDGSSKPAGNKPRTIAPVAISQIQNCPEDGLKIKDIDVQVVRVVAIVKAIEVSTIKVSYTLEDASGSILAVSYVESEEESTVPVIENTYAVVIGSVRTQTDNKHIMIFSIYPVTDINEVFEHYLAVIHVGMKAEHMGMKMETSAMKQEMISSYGNGMQSSAMSQMEGIEPKYRKIYEIITKTTQESGMNIDEIYASLTVKVPIEQIRAGLEWLAGEGYIFTTIDEQHYKSTDSYV